MATYATLDDCTDLIYGLELTNTDVDELILLEAEREIDRILGPRVDPTVVDATGLRVDLDDLTANETLALMRAVVFQFEYHVKQGADFFIYPQSREKNGERLPRIAPKALDELTRASLLRMTGSIGTPSTTWEPGWR